MTDATLEPKPEPAASSEPQLATKETELATNPAQAEGKSNDAPTVCFVFLRISAPLPCLNNAFTDPTRL